jgi:hypothetical protein
MRQPLEMLQQVVNPQRSVQEHLVNQVLLELLQLQVKLQLMHLLHPKVDLVGKYGY